MDWLKLFTLLVAVAFITVKADGPKKKIRIHLPQKVKHIHHHKKIYITNHPAPSQYAPAYMPSAEGTMAISSNVALPSMANIIPLNSVDIYDEPQRLQHGASQILPLYHARGYYGPTPNDIEEHDYEASAESEYSPGFSSHGSHSSHPKRVKIIKLNDQPRKKVIRKPKPKRVVVRNKPYPPVAPDVEHPVSTFHEHFYSDVDGSGTIKKIRKPPRVEKIVDGDTEHIHTYSEEHIHKLFYDDSPKIGVLGVDQLTGMSSISGGQSIIPFKSGATLVALPSHPFAGLSAVGPVINGQHFEYSAYNPREVTHDHIFHDHGEIPADIELNKDSLGLPPKVSYNSQGLKISGNQKRPKTKIPQKPKKNNKPTDFSYYESMFSSNSKPGKLQRPSASVPTFDATGESDLEEFRPIPDFGYKENKKNRNPSFYGKTSNDYRGQQASVPAPFAVSSTVVHDYKPKRYSASAPASLTKIRDPFANFKDSYANNFEYDNYAASSNIYTSEDKNDAGYAQEKGNNKKSISTQNVSFGGQNRVSYVDHLESESMSDDIDDGPTALENIDDFEQTESIDTVTPTAFTSNDLSSAQQYFSLMAKAFQGNEANVPEPSNDNFRHAQIPATSTNSYTPGITSTTPSTQYNSQNNESKPSVASRFRNIADTKGNHRNKEANQHINQSNGLLDKKQHFKPKSLQNHETFSKSQDNSSIVRGNLKYGDKI